MTGGGEDKGRFQTALLTLGATHTHFGHVKEALTSLNETVRLGCLCADIDCTETRQQSHCQLAEWSCTRFC